MTQREPCVVPGCCNSSAKYIGFRYICSRHWREVPRWMKRRRSKMSRKFLAKGWLYLAGPNAMGYDWARTSQGKRARYLMNKAWDLMERAAIKRAAGL